MKHMKHGRLLLLAISIPLLFNTPATALERQLPTAKGPPAVTRSMIRFVELKQKLDPNARCLFDEKLGYCVNISGWLSVPRTIGKPSDALEITKQFLRLHGEIFRLPSIDTNFQCNLQKKNRDNDPNYVACRQTVAGVPIYGAMLTTAVASDGVVRSVDTTHKADVPENFSATPRLKENEAKTAAGRDLGKNATWEAKGLFAYEDEKNNKWRLVYIFNAYGKMTFIQYKIDAMTGEIVSKLDKSRSETCTPKVVTWDTSGLGNRAMPICKETDNYLLYTGAGYHPAPYETHDMSIDEDKIVEYPSWPPQGTEAARDMIIHAITMDVLQYYLDTYQQYSWCGYNVRSCPLFMHVASELTNAIGQWNGGGNAYFSVPLPFNPQQCPLFPIGHEIGHGVVDAYYNGSDDYRYCNEDHPESAGIEEGIVSLFDSLGPHALLFRDKAAWYNENTQSYQTLLRELADRYTLHNAEPENESAAWCGAHAFGDQLIFSTAFRLTYGYRDNSGQLTGVDVNNLMQPIQIGRLFMETIRHKQTWKRDATSMASAVLSTCADFTPLLFTPEQCKNVERAFLTLGITPSGSLGATLLGPQDAPIFEIDLSMLRPDISFGFNEISSNYFMSITSRYAVSSLETILSTYGNGFFGVGLIELLNSDGTGYLVSTCSSSTTELSCKLPPVEWVMDSTATDLVSRTLHYPFLDTIRTFVLDGFFSLSGDFEPYISIRNINAANGRFTMKVAPDLAASVDITLAPASEQPSCGTSSPIRSFAYRIFGRMDENCQKKWIVTVNATNVGNKPTFPIAQSELYSPSPNLTVSKLYQTLAEREMQVENMPPAELDQNEDIRKWRNGIEGTTVPVVRPGESFKVTSYEIIAKPSDRFFVILLSPIPELGVLNNIVEFRPKDFFDQGCQPAMEPKCMKLTLQKMQNSVTALAKNISEARNILQDPASLPPMGHDPVFDDLLFNPGERVLLPPGKDGRYSPSAFPDAGVENRASLNVLAKTAAPASKKNIFKFLMNK